MVNFSQNACSAIFFQTLLEAKEEENVESFTEAVSTLLLKGKSLNEKNRW